MPSNPLNFHRARHQPLDRARRFGPEVSAETFVQAEKLVEVE